MHYSNPDTSALTKIEKYTLLIQHTQTLIHAESDIIATLSNITALLKQLFDFHWCGFYLVKTDHQKTELVLGPFQGPVACTRIALGRGVCGTAWKEKRIITVPDVHAFPGHIACSPFSKSEMVVPVFKNNQVVMVLDIDSDQPASFDETDEKYLRQLSELVSTVC